MRWGGLWRIWTPGWGFRSWWFWVTDSGFPLWVAWKLPRRIALWAFIRVVSATGQSPSEITYESAYKAWEAGAGK